MNITPMIMSSAGSSAWGANRVDLSWPIIESYLFDNNFLKNRSIVYSMGGDNDNGDNLSDKGIEILESSIPNNVNFINEFSLIDNISKKINFLIVKVVIIVCMSILVEVLHRFRKWIR